VQHLHVTRLDSAAALAEVPQQQQQQQTGASLKLHRPCSRLSAGLSRDK